MAKRAHVLVASSNPIERMRFQSILAKEAYGCSEASAAGEVASLARERRPDAILLGGSSDEAQLLALIGDLKRRPDTAHTPTMLAVRHSSEALRRHCVGLGLEELVEGAHDEGVILPRLRPLARLAILHAELALRTATARDFGLTIDIPDVRRFDARPSRILLVGPSGATVQAILAGLGENVTVELEPDHHTAAARIEQGSFDGLVLVINRGIDPEHPLHLSAHVRHNPTLFELPVLLVYDQDVLDQPAEAYRAGVSVALPQPVDIGLLRASLRLLVTRQRLRWNIRDALKLTLGDGTCDEATGVYSAQFLRAHLGRLIASTQARDAFLSAAVLSIPSVADTEGQYGADAAKLLVVKVADWIGGLVRAEDLTARTGSAEFCVVLPGTAEPEARMVAERVAGVLHQSEFALGEEIMAPIRVRVDVGITALEGDDTVDSLLARAQRNAR